MMAPPATDPAEAPGAEERVVNARWSRAEEAGGFFSDEDRLRGRFLLTAAVGGGLLALTIAGLLRLQKVALAPPVFVGVAHGLIFSGRPEPLSSVVDQDFDRQLSDTIEVLFGRTEKGLPPAIREFCAPEVVAAVDQAYRDAAANYPAGYVQTLALLEAKTVAARTGYRRMRYRGLLSSRSVDRAQASPIYLEATFVIGAPTPLNATGWRLVRLDALSREEFYRDEQERAVRKTLELPPPGTP
ncbi:MAG: hypothetical protein ABSA05_07940 [Opitutaceae bacterium]